MRFLSLILFPVLIQAAVTSLQFAPLQNTQARGFVQLSNSSVAIYGAQQSPCTNLCSQSESPFLVILDATGKEIHSPPHGFGSGNSVINGAAADAAGNIWIVGQTNSDDFPLVRPLYANKISYGTVGFAAKLDPNLNILFSTFLGTGQATFRPTEATNIALDSAGNASVVGDTMEYLNFPVTGPPFAGTGQSGLSASFLTYTFITRISADGSSLQYSRLLGGSGTFCQGVSSCVGSETDTIPTAIALDSNANLIVTGNTGAPDFPITSGTNTHGGAFVSSISADGSRLLWSSLVENIVGSGSSRQVTFVQSIALDGAGSIYIAGESPDGVATTAGVLQPALPAGAKGYGGFVAKISGDGTKALTVTNLSGTNGSTLAGIALDTSGNIWVSGSTSSSDFPGLSDPSGSTLDFLVQLDPTASTERQSFALVPGTVVQPIMPLPGESYGPNAIYPRQAGFDTDGRLLLLSSAGNLLRLDPATANSAAAVFALTNAAAPVAAGQIAPGEIATVYGLGLGPTTGVSSVPDANGIYPTQLGGVSILFNGNVSAPILYAGAHQINFQVPFGLSGSSSTTGMTLTTPNGELAPISIPVGTSIGIFGAVNQDGTVNGPSNPAPEGSIISLYANGLGSPSFGSPDGAIATAANPAFLLRVDGVWQTPGQTPGFRALMPVLYAGTAPGLINGADQINVQLPPGIANPLIYLNQVTSSSDLVTQTAIGSSNMIVVYTQ